jgi:hypothetical protein
MAGNLPYRLSDAVPGGTGWAALRFTRCGAKGESWAAHGANTAYPLSISRNPAQDTPCASSTRGHARRCGEHVLRQPVRDYAENTFISVVARLR